MRILLTHIVTLFEVRPLPEKPGVAARRKEPRSALRWCGIQREREKQKTRLARRMRRMTVLNFGRRVWWGNSHTRDIHLLR